MEENRSAFYLGRLTNEAGEPQENQPYNYPADDLTTHAVVVGMTGSGKTGLCIDLLEEAAMDGIPSLVIDPKGDVSNLLLTFPDLRPDDFAPWISEDEARREGLSLPDAAAAAAKNWREGLAKWGQSGERIRALKEAAEFAVYTPGSDAARPVNILNSLKSPNLSWEDEAEALHDQISGTVAALLSLLNIEADPIRSREYILLTNLIEAAWREGKSLDLLELIRQVQKPPIRTLGAFDIDTFYPQKERMELALMLNGIIASPAFAVWLKGQPLDIASFLHAPSGKPQVSIFSVGHLSDAERMFFITLLLENVVSWMRSQPGTSSLRCLLYFDEVFGYFPPTANPPSKRPLLTLLKQARAFGLGVTIVTQNPMDLDYKGLTNAGTWFIGKLSTDRDKARLLDGMEGALVGGYDRSKLDEMITGLRPRTFIVNNIHDKSGAKRFTSRWAMSYLCGPLTKAQLRLLTRPAAGEEKGGVAGQPLAGAAETAAIPAAGAAGGLGAYAAQPPTVAETIPQCFLPAAAVPDSLRSRNLKLLFRPRLLGFTRVNYLDRAKRIDVQDTLFYLLIPPEKAMLLRWEEAELLPLKEKDLDLRPRLDALYEAVPETLANARGYKSMQADFTSYVLHESALEVPYNPALGLTGQPGMSPDAFLNSLEESLREARKKEVDKIREGYEKKIEKLQEKIKKEQYDLDSSKAEMDARKRDEVINIGESALSLLLGRKPLRAITSASRKRRMSEKAGEDFKESQETIAGYQKELQKMQDEMAAETQEIGEEWDKKGREITQLKLEPKKQDITVEFFGLAWAPYWLDVQSQELTPAYERKE